MNTGRKPDTTGSDWPPVEMELVGGKYDGATIWTLGQPMPEVIFVRDWISEVGDGRVAWRQGKTEEFRYCYILDGFKYVFNPRIK